MKPYILKFEWAIIFVAGAVIIFNGCKKTDHSVNNKETEDTKAKAIQATIERYGRVTAPIIFQPRQPASTISYKDVNGNLIMYGGTQHNRTEGICGQYTCNTTSDPNDLYTDFTLEYIKWFYTCGNNSTGQHDLTAIWKVSVPYTLLLQSGSNYSYGNIRILSGGSVILTSGNLGQNNMEITNLGTDPNCSANTLYDVRYTWLDVADTYFPDNSIEASFTIYNDCAITNNNTIVGYTFGATYTNQTDVFTHPCDRTDQAWVNPNTGPNNQATILGAYNICTPPSGFTGTSNHQVEYRLVDHSTSLLWDDQSSTVYWGSTTGSSYSPVPTMNSLTGILFLYYMTPNSGDWLVRYRNIHSGCTPGSYSNNSNWDDINTGFRNWVTEYWPL